MSDQLHFQATSSFDSPPLQLGQVHLWWVSLDISEQQEKQFSEELNDRQRQKVERLQGAELKKFYIAGRGYLNQLLKHYVCKSSDSINSTESINSIALDFGEQGKPFLRNNPNDLCFNFTDTCGYGLFAFALSSELGIDLENSERQGNFKRIVERRFAPQEQYLQDKPMPDFLRCWTRKEAFGKAVGTGLNYPLREHVMCEDLSSNECALESEGFYGQQISIKIDSNDFIACVFSHGQKAKELRGFQLIL